MTIPLATPDDLEDFQASDPARMLEWVSSVVHGYCGWHISPRLTQTIKVDGDGSRHLWLPSLKVDDVTEVKSDGVTLDPESYDWSESGYLELRCGRFSSRPRGVEVTLDHGHVFTPGSVMEVVVSIAARSGDTGGNTMERAGQVQVSFGTFNGVSGGIALLEHEKALLAPHKLPPRA